MGGIKLSDSVIWGGCACIVHAMGRIHPHRAHILDLVTPTPGRVLFGQAATISHLPVRLDVLDAERHSFGHLFYEAVGNEPQGKVLVMASHGHTQVSMGGGAKLSRLQHHHLAGLLTDARVRDFRDLARHDFAVYCKGETVRWGGDVLMPFQSGVPVVLDGVTVLPGDYVFADPSGAVVIPSGSIRPVLQEAEAIVAADLDSLTSIHSEPLHSNNVNRNG